MKGTSVGCLSTINSCGKGGVFVVVKHSKSFCFWRSRGARRPPAGRVVAVAHSITRTLLHVLLPVLCGVWLQGEGVDPRAQPTGAQHTESQPPPRAA